jgi:two-component system, OmpR family, response regulator
MSCYVLHVDDDPSIREVVRLALESVGGFEVASAECGQSALQQIRSRRPDVVLLDVMMPSMDGPETLLALRELPEGRALPVIFLTAKVLKTDLDRLRELGAADILQKPFRIRELVEALRCYGHRQAV